MKNTLFRGLTALSLGTALLGLTVSCTKDLDQDPKYELTPDRQFTGLAGYRQVLNKLYAGFAVSGQADAGSSDISGIDGGTGNYLRQLWSAQELPTDEAVVAWPDPGIQDWHNMNWGANNVLVNGLYNRLYYEISICNEFLRQSTDEMLGSRGISGDDAAEIRRYRTEARFLRAVSYYNVVDLYGNGPYATEVSVPTVGDTPPFYTRQQLFGFVEAELLACATSLPLPHGSEYGRVDQAAAWGYLARLYLNAVVYTGTPPTGSAPHTDGTARWTDAATYAKKVLDAGYTLNTTASSAASAYGRNFLADNDGADTRKEIIWPIIFDRNTTQSFGGTTFLVNGSTSSFNTNWQRVVGQTTGWGGLRGTSALFDLFFRAGGDTTRDLRGRFWLTPPRAPFQAKASDTAKVRQYLRITSLSDFTRGPGVLKYRNVTSTGAVQDNGQHFSSVDYPMLRASEMMLIYAEAALRGNTDQAQALEYLKQVRNRAFNRPLSDPAGTVSLADIGSDYSFILDERGRELYWEGMRRTDLIRFKRFVEGTYLWPWKGGAVTGTAVAGFRELYPLPVSDLTVNSNLKQNAGY